MRDKRQRHAGERDHAEHRADVDKGLQENDERETERDESAEEVLRVPCYHDAARREREEERNKNNRADKSGFLREDGEN